MTMCSACGRESDEGFRFCPHCGGPLAGTVAPGVERKVVTVLFCDLVGFTARSDRADPEDVRAILRPFHALARRAIEAHGGTLDKFIGDAAMGVFGSPAAHEDDPERAVRAALRILQDVDRVNRDRPVVALAVRIGVNTGEAVVALAGGVQEGEAVAGDVVNTASRLESAAPVGTVLVSESTYLATRTAFRYETVDAITVKGKADPLPVWRPVDTVSAVGAGPERDRATPFVGRGAELDRLAQELRRAVQGRAVRLVSLVGEAGVGKSRLLEEFRSMMDAGPDRVSWRRGRCLPYGEGVSFWALGEIVKDHAGILESDPGPVREGKLDAALEPLVSDPSERAWLRARLGPLAGLESSAGIDREESFAAWRRFLETLAGVAPVVVEIEDLHWADAALLAFIEHVASPSSRGPMLLVVTARPELQDRHPDWAAAISGIAAIHLRSLDHDDTRELVTALLGPVSLPAEARSLLEERAGGNPLYAEEFVRMLKDQGGTEQAERLVAERFATSLPSTVQAVVAARLDTLPPDRKAVVQDASVIGRVFWLGAVAALAGGHEAAVRPPLAALTSMEIVGLSPATTVRDQEEYTFSHAIVRDVAYSQIARGTRAAKHRAAATWIEAIAGADTADLTEILAHHATQALELAVAAGELEDVDELRSSARRHLRMAGARALALDVADAERRFEQALELAPEGHPDRSRIQAALAEAAFQSGRLDDAEALYVEAVDGLRLDASTTETADAMVRLSVVLEYRGDPDRGRALLGEAIAMLEALPPGPALARALTESAGTFLVAARYEDTVREADRAIEMAGASGDAESEVRAHGFRGYARVVLGHLDGVQEQREALRAGRAQGLGRAVAVGYSNLGDCLSMVEGNRSALETFREGLEFAEARGLREAAGFLRNSMLGPLLDLGDWDRVLEMSAEVAAEARRAGAGYDEVWAEVEGARIDAYRRGQDAVAGIEDVLDRARAIGDRPMVIGPLAAAALARAWSGDSTQAAALVQEALDLTAGDSLIVRAAVLPDLVRVAVEVGDVALGERLTDGMEALPLARHRSAALSGRAVLAEARGMPDRALDLFREAADRWTEFGTEVERGHALWGVGRCLVALDRPAEAREALTSARAVFTGLRAGPIVASIDAGLESLALLARLDSNQD